MSEDQHAPPATPEEAKPIKLKAVRPVPQPEPWMTTAMRMGRSAEQINALATEYERQRAYEARLAFDRAWVLCQQKLSAVLKSKEVNFAGKGGGRVNYWYAPLSDVIDAIRPVLAEYGLGYLPSSSNTDTHVTVKTVLMGHGHREEPGCCFTVPRDDTGSKNLAQGLGSAQTYAQRYTLLGACGLATAEDTDGRVTNAATSGNGQPAAEQIITPAQVEILQLELAELVAKDKDFLSSMLKGCQISALQYMQVGHYAYALNRIKARKQYLAKQEAVS